MKGLIEDGAIGIKTLASIVALTWVAGTGVAVFASNIENDVENLEEDVRQMREADDDLADATKQLTDAVINLNTNVLLLEQRIELEASDDEREEE
jgi:uncharacterized protein YoxC